MKESAKVWTVTRTQGLLRHKNGTYYARVFIGGKEKWKSLRTKTQAVALARLSDYKREIRNAGVQDVAARSGNLTFGGAVRIHIERMEKNPEQKPATVHYHRQLIKALGKAWPGVMERPLNRITKAACGEWSARFGGSSTRYNGTLHLLRSIFSIGVEYGAITSSPADGIKRRAVRPRKPDLPTREQFEAMLKEIRAAGGRFSKASADLVAGLAFTGMRLGEAMNVLWRDVDLSARMLHIKGDPQTGTKNWETRKVPLAPQAVELFREIKESTPQDKATDRVFVVSEAQKSLDRAAKRVGCQRITHHDLRDLFATTCIENGIDIPTISGWLGHKDGGALLMRVYGHRRDEHSMAQAQRISFAPLTRQESAQPPSEGPSSYRSPQ